MAGTSTEAALLRLLQLASPGLPVGGFAWSLGLEFAVDSGWLEDDAAAEHWLLIQLDYSLAHMDLALVPRFYRCFADGDRVGAVYWNRWLLACRETRELRMTECAMGEALVTLMPSIQLRAPDMAGGQTAFVTAFAFAAWQWQIPARLCALGIAWSWLENQVAAATKLVPLGQTRAQQMLGTVQASIPAALDRAFAFDDEELGCSLPGLAMASALHETQYSRLFRS